MYGLLVVLPPHRDRRRYVFRLRGRCGGITIPGVEGGSAGGEENANLYVRGPNEGRRGEQPDPSSLIDLLDVFGEEGLRAYLMGFREGREEGEGG